MTYVPAAKERPVLSQNGGMRIGSPLGLPLQVTALAIGAPEPRHVRARTNPCIQGSGGCDPVQSAGVAYLLAGAEGRGGTR